MAGYCSQHMIRQLYGIVRRWNFGPSSSKLIADWPNRSDFSSSTSILRSRSFSSDVVPQPHLNQSNAEEFSRYLRQRIRATGAMTVAEYMKECLTNPYYGYYSRKNPFGRQGDFITSPEVCQIFGELIAIWCVNEWSITGGQLPVQIIELGPGTGTLASDMLRIIKSFPRLREQVSFHFVEKSRDLATEQARLFGVSDVDKFTEGQADYKHGISKFGIPVSWYMHFDDIPHGNCYVVANEFFDALPIHKFQKTDHGFREILVDITEDDSKLRFVLAAQDTPASKMIPPEVADRSHLELSIEGGILASNIAERVNSNGGAALIIDYGHSGTKDDTFRAFRKHKATDPLENPGESDLTADVDFSLLRALIGTKAVTSGPISQSQLLTALAFEKRFDSLLKACKTQEEQQRLIGACDLLINPEKMGGKFFAFCIAGHKRTQFGKITAFE